MAKKKIFFDLEFTGLHKLTTAISVGLVCEDGKKFYAEFTDFDKYQIDDFLRTEVLSKLILEDYDFETDYNPDAETVYVKGDVELIYTTLNAWLLKYKEDGVEMWGDAPAYDWVLFINIFGNGLAMPSFVDYIPMDLATALKLCGIDKEINRNEYAYGKEIAELKKDKKHNSLYDAETQLEVYKKVLSLLKEAGNEDNIATDDEEIEEETIPKEDLQQLSDDLENKVVEEIEVVKEVVEEFEEVEVEEVQAVKTPKKKGRGRPKKEVEPIKSDVRAPKVEFIEPTQNDINATEEWNPPI